MIFAVTNQGIISSVGSTISLLIDGVWVDTQPCPPLNAGATYEGIFAGPYLCSNDEDTVEVCVDSVENSGNQGEIEEDIENNNCVSTNISLTTPPTTTIPSPPSTTTTIEDSKALGGYVIPLTPFVSK